MLRLGELSSAVQEPAIDPQRRFATVYCHTVRSLFNDVGDDEEPSGRQVAAERLTAREAELEPNFVRSHRLNFHFRMLRQAVRRHSECRTSQIVLQLR